jgi:hypothetical protein
VKVFQRNTRGRTRLHDCAEFIDHLSVKLA